MDRTKEEIATRALRLLGVCASDEPPSADQMASALAVLDGIFAELRSEAQPTWDIVTGTPPEAVVPLANWLAAELAGEYGVAAPMTRARAKLRLLAVVRPDDRAPDDGADPDADYGLGARIVYRGGDAGSGTDTDYTEIYETGAGGASDTDYVSIYEGSQ